MGPHWGRTMIIPKPGCVPVADHDYYITDEEVKQLLRDADERATPKWQLYIYLALFLGRRSQVTLAINIRDFPGWKNLDLSRLTVRENKRRRTERVHTIPVPEILQEILLEYIYIFRDTLYKGYLFPAAQRSRFKRPYEKSESASAYFSKARARIGGTFLERYEGGVYRIHAHTLRHWYETRIAEIEKDPYFLKKLMGYESLDTVLSYVRVKDYNHKAAKVLDNAFSGFLKDMVHTSPDQSTLGEFS